MFCHPLGCDRVAELGMICSGFQDMSVVSALTIIWVCYLHGLPSTFVGTTPMFVQEFHNCAFVDIIFEVDTLFDQ